LIELQVNHFHRSRAGRLKNLSVAVRIACEYFCAEALPLVAPKSAVFVGRLRYSQITRSASAGAILRCPPFVRIAWIRPLSIYRFTDDELTAKASASCFDDMWCLFLYV